MPSYTKTVWQDLPNTTTPVNATNLNNIENGIETLYNNQVVVNDSYNTSTDETYSCNYINNIIESGSNANGNWIKYSDGTMICTARKQITTTRNTSYGNVLYVSPKINAFAYPQSFTTINSVTLNAEAQDNSVWLLTADLGTITQTPTFYIAGVTSAGSNIYYISYTTIGKWK